MPSAHDYRSAAATLAPLAAITDEHAMALLGLPLVGVFGTGPVAGEVDAAVGAAAQQLRDANRALLRLIDECHHRASVCDDFVRQRHEYWARVERGDFSMPYPMPPFPWVPE